MLILPKYFDFGSGYGTEIEILYTHGLKQTVDLEFWSLSSMISFDLFRDDLFNTIGYSHIFQRTDIGTERWFNSYSSAVVKVDSDITTISLSRKIIQEVEEKSCG